MPDLDRFERDLAGAAFDPQIHTDILEGTAIGVSSTPSFVVNGTPVLGAQPVDVFREVVDAAAGRPR